MKKSLHISGIVLRLVLGVFFIISAYLKLYPVEMLELSIAETGMFSWTQSMIMARLLIGFELFLGVMIISGAYKKLTWIATILTLAVFSIYLVYIIYFMPGLSDCGCMGLKVHISPLNSIYKNMFLIAICGLTWFLDKKSTGKWLNDVIAAKWILITAFVISFSLPFILNTLIIDREEQLSRNPLLTNTIDLNEDPFLTWHSNDTLQISKGKKLICFFSPSCRFCIMAARKIRVILKDSPEQFAVYFIFAGNPKSREKLAPFFKESMTEFIPTAIIDNDKFFSISSQNLPVVFYVDGDSIKDRDNFMTLSEDRIMQFFAISK